MLFEGVQKKVHIADGREIGITEYGDPSGPVVLAFHGIPRVHNAAAYFYSEGVKVRLIGVDRPGIGESTFARNRTVASYAKDIEQLCMALGIESFSILAISGGAPYAMAVALAMPNRVKRLGLISGLCRRPTRELLEHSSLFTKISWWTMRLMPWWIFVSGALLKLLFKVVPRYAMHSMLAHHIRVDRRLVGRLADSKKGPAMIAMLRDEGMGTVRGFARDAQLLTREWGINLEDLTVPIDVWHGVKDDIVPIASARALAKLVPHVRLREFEHEGHQSLIFRYGKSMLHLVLGEA